MVDWFRGNEAAIDLTSVATATGDAPSGGMSSRRQ